MMGTLLSAFQSRVANLQKDLERIKGSAAFKDILEAAVAGCVIIGAADGDYDDKEKNETIDTLSGTKFVETAGISVAQITDLTNKFTDYRPGSRGGRERLMEEIREAGRRPEVEPFRNAIVMSWLDVAEKSGDMDEKEKAALIKCAEALGVRNINELLAS